MASTPVGTPMNDSTGPGGQFLDEHSFVSLDTDDRVADTWGNLAASPSAPAPLALVAGSEPVPGYRLVAWLGRGGSGEVWRAVGPGGFPLAMKFIRLGGKDDTVQLRSLELMKEVRHAHLLTLFGAWNHGGLLTLGMELADRTLLDRYHEAVGQGQRGIPFPELIESIRQAALGIDFFNEPRHNGPGRKGVGIQHRDIKPQNLFLVGGSVKVGDFGLAKTLEDVNTTHTGSMTLAYAAPELFHGHVSSQSDQYSLAVTYCHLRTGLLPFRGNPAVVTSGHLFRDPDLTALPPRERPVVARALDKRPRSRWPNCGTFVNALMIAHGARTRHIAGGFTRGPADSTPSTLGATFVSHLSRLTACVAGLLAFMAIVLYLASLDPGPISRPGHAARIDGPREDANPKKGVTPVEISRGPEGRPGPSLVTSDAITRARFDGAPSEPKDPIIPLPPPPLTANPPEPDPAVQQRSVPDDVDINDRPLIAIAVREMVDVEPDQVESARPEGDQGSKPTIEEVSGPGKGQDVTGTADAQEKSEVHPGRRPSTDVPTARGSDLDMEQHVLPRPSAATIYVLMPSANSELVVRGEVGRGNPDEWYGPKRVIHTPVLAGRKDYLIGAFWKDESGKPLTRKNELGVEPGGVYEIDLRQARSTWRELPGKR